MSRLYELQKQFSAHLNAKPNSISQHVINNHIDNDGRLRIYQNNYIFLLTDRLRALYSSVENLVGKQYFKQLAKAYVSQYPARQSALNDFGANFADFLTDNHAQHQLDYLSDIARFEWLQTLVWQEADADAIDVFHALSQVPENAHDKIVFTLHPATRLFHSQHAIDNIFELTQGHLSSEQMNYKLTSRYWLLFREDGKVLYRDIDEIEYKFLSAVKNQQSLQLIMELDEQMPVKFSDILVKFVQLGHIIDFTLLKN